MSDDITDLRNQIKDITAERNRYHAELTDLSIKTLRLDVDDHEARIRAIEIIGTRFNTLYAMFAGNGLMSIVILLRLFTHAGNGQ